MIGLVIAFLFENPVGHPALVGLGMTSALPQGSEGIFSSPATLVRRGYTAYLSLPYGGLGVGLHHVGLAYVQPVAPSLVMGVFAQQVGARIEGTYTGRYGEITIGFSGSYGLTPNIRGGWSVKLLRYQDPRSGVLVAPGMDVGVLFTPQRFWRLGVVLQNFNRPRIGVADELIPPVIEVSLAFLPYEGTITVVGVRQVEGFPVRWSVGQEVRLNAYPVTFRLSLQREGDVYTAFAAGGRLDLAGMSVDYAAQIRPGLPVSHGIALNRVW